MRIYIGNNYRGRLTNHQIIPAGMYDSERLNSQHPGLADYLIISGVAVLVDDGEKVAVVETEIMPEPEATPAAKKFADENGIDLRTVPGTGKGGKVTKIDVLDAVGPVDHEQALKRHDRKQARNG